MYEVWAKDGIGIHADKMLRAFVSNNLESAVKVQNRYLKRGVCALIRYTSQELPSSSPSLLSHIK